MKNFHVTVITGLIAILFTIAFPPAIFAQDDSGVTTDEPTSVSETEIALSDVELDALLTRVDRFFIDQDMADLTVDIDVYRDPSNRLNDRNIREGDPSDIAGLTTLISHYAYTWPDYYELMVMGEMLAGSELPADTSFFSQMLPLPGAPIYTEDLRARFRIRFMGTDEVDGVPVYKVRYTAVDRDTEFFNYIDYFIGIGREVILRVESTFESPWYYGNAGGDFYYDEWLGKYLPIYGHGSVLYYPNHSSDVWGRWYNWDWKSAEEAAADSGEPVPEDENSGSVSE